MKTLLLLILPLAFAFTSPAIVSTRQQQQPQQQHKSPSLLYSSRSSSAPSDVLGSPSLNDLKSDLVRTCTRPSKPLLEEVRGLVSELEAKAEDVGIGQASSVNGLLSGEWECLYSPEDLTRSSPFFWAFRKAFPEQADQIFGITDAIPSPIKDVGPAIQTILLDGSSSLGSGGSFKSQVTVATLNGVATSIMTTKGTIMGIDGVDGIQIKIETTKPEESTLLKLALGPLFSVVNDKIPAFPSGEALEQVQPGASQVVMRTTFCDETLRISRNDDDYANVFVWKRAGFQGSPTL